MDRKKSITHEPLGVGTEAEYKCSTCGNMYPITNAACDVCGHQCSEDTCQIIRVSNQDY